MTAATLDAIRNAMESIHEELAKVIVGHQDVVEQLMVTVLAGQHALLEAAPGSAKNLLVQAVAKTLGLDILRVHCTPDLSPGQLIEQAMHTSGSQSESPAADTTMPHVFLVDDISRLMPKTRVIVQQAMLEGEINFAGRRYEVPTPFIVLASKYRHEEEPADVADEPRDDRFMLKIAIRFPSYQDEFHLTDTPSPSSLLDVTPRLDAAHLVQFRQTANTVVAPAHVVHYGLRLVRSTRVHEGQTPDFAYEWIGMGAGPRASHHLMTAAKMRAALGGRDVAGIEDVQAMLHCVLRHRLVANQNARANGITPDRIIDRLIYEIPVRIEGDDEPAVAGDAPKFDVTSDDQWISE